MERKGENKKRDRDMKLINENKDDLVNPETLELPDEPQPDED
jgi:hypothetical protein